VDEEAVPLPSSLLPSTPPTLPHRAVHHSHSDASATPSSSFGTSLFGGWMDDAGLPTNPRASATVSSPPHSHAAGGVKGPGSLASGTVAHRAGTGGAGSEQGTAPSPRRPTVRIQEYGPDEAEEEGADDGDHRLRHGVLGPEARTPRRSGYVALAMTSNALAGGLGVGIGNDIAGCAVPGGVQGV
jgi:hypothetical protein